MKKFYATRQADSDGTIEEDSDIHAFETFEEAKRFLIFGEADAFAVDGEWHVELEEGVLCRLEITAGHWGDCWTKSPVREAMRPNTDPFYEGKRLREPDPGYTIAPFSHDELAITDCHPGPQSHAWVTPDVPVFVVTYKPAHTP